jgi:Na+-translocating ferredoxin:NAD+ oxidoreductase RnfD subunit/GNAT superfamily N-acetyltransferase
MRRTRFLPPHIYTRDSYIQRNWSLCIALAIPFLASILIYGVSKPFILLLLSVVAAILAEIFFSLLFSQHLHLEDGWVVSIGMLVCLLLPGSVSYALPPLAAALAVFLGKTLPGGQGRSFFHPVLLGLLFLALFFPQAIGYSWPGLESLPSGVRVPTWIEQLVSGAGSGALGSTSVLALFFSAVFLLIRGSLDWRTTLLFLVGSFGLFPFVQQTPATQLFAADTIFFALFLIPDPSTSPLKTRYRMLYALLAGLFTIPFRFTLGPVLGILFSWPFASILVPLFDFLAYPSARGYLWQAPVLRTLSFVKGIRGAGRMQPTTKKLPSESDGKTEDTVSARPKHSRQHKVVLPLFWQINVAEARNSEEFHPPCTPEIQPEHRFFWQKRLEEGWRFFQAQMGEETVGCLQLAPLKSAWIPVAGSDFLSLACLYVVPTRRGRGIGRGLLEKALELAQNHSGICAVTEDLAIGEFLQHFGLEPMPANHGACFYRKASGEEMVHWNELPPRSLPEGKVTLDVAFSLRCPHAWLRYQQLLNDFANGPKELVLRPYLVETPGQWEGVYLNGERLGDASFDRKRLRQLVQDKLETIV